jgi:hypothetical protein
MSINNITIRLFIAGTKNLVTYKLVKIIFEQMLTP